MGLGCEGFTSIKAGLISELWNNANFQVETDIITTVALSSSTGNCTSSNSNHLMALTRLPARYAFDGIILV